MIMPVKEMKTEIFELLNDRSFSGIKLPTIHA